MYHHPKTAADATTPLSINVDIDIDAITVNTPTRPISMIEFGAIRVGLVTSNVGGWVLGVVLRYADMGGVW